MYFVEEKEIEISPREFRYGIPGDLYSDWIRAQKRIGLPQTQILHRLVRFLLSQDELTQGMILGTLTPRPDLLAYILNSKLRTAGRRKAALDREPGGE